LKNRNINIAIVVYLLVTIVPLFAGLGYALLNSFGLAGIISNGFTLSYWHIFFTSGEFEKSFLYSFILTLVILLLSVIISLIISISYNSNVNTGKSAYLFYIPLAIPFMVAGFLTYQLFNPTGFFSRVAYSLHLTSSPSNFPDITNDALSIGIVITHVFIATAFLTILFAGIFKNEKIEELAILATSIGANRREINRRVVIPIILKKTFPSITLYGIFILSSYEIPLLLGRQTPQFISVAIANKFQKFNLQDIPLAYCMAVVYTFIIILILFYLSKRNKLYHEND